jgi:PAS domain S-box-containing protein
VDREEAKNENLRTRVADVERLLAERSLAYEAALARLRASERSFRALAENACDGIIIVNSERRVVFANYRAAEIAGRSQNELLSAPFDSFVHSDELPILIDRFIRRMSREPVIETYETRYVKPDGTTVHVEVSASRTVWDGKPAGSGIIRDISARKLAEEQNKKLEAQLQQSQKMEAVGKLAGGIAHDFNNLLSVIISNCGFVLDGLPAESTARPDVLEIQKAARRAADLTRQLLAFSRRSIIQPEVLCVNDAIVGMEKMLKRTLGEDIVLEVFATTGLPAVKVDRGQLEQVIMNLAVNSRDAMPRGGRLMLETSAIRLDEEYVKTHAEVAVGDYVLLAVSDTGCGMSKEVTERAFEPFFTMKEVGKGTGLGLSTVYGIVKQAGGHVGIYSVEGQGTTVKVYLPAVPDAETATTDKPAETVASFRGRGETVFLVEDEAPVRAVARKILERGGYRVVEAPGGAEAIEACRYCERKFDLLLTDVVMPGMSGRETAEELKAMGCAAKVVFMSGYTSNIIAHHGVLDENVEFLFKPFSEESLLKKVREVLDKGPEVTSGQ